jgi:hypothetical protein
MQILDSISPQNKCINEARNNHIEIKNIGATQNHYGSETLKQVSVNQK